MRAKVRKAILKGLRELEGARDIPEADLPYFTVETPPEEKFGDFSSNVAMGLAKPLKSAPRKIAESLAATLKSDPLFERIDIAGPGFINFFIKRNEWVSEFKSIPDESSDYGNLPEVEGEKIMVEFVSANPTGPLHIGHGRGAAYGDTLSRLLKKAGYNVTREYYINDAGNQMNNLGLSTLARYREIAGEKVEFPENGYQGDYIKDIAQEIFDKDGDQYLSKPENEAVPYFTKHSSDSILGGIKEDLKKFRVSFDEWVSEKTFHDGGKVEETIKKLQASGDIFEEDDALWLKTTDAGDEKNRVVKRSNGLTTYLAADIAYHEDKYNRGYTELIDIWGADHHGYVARMKAAVAALGKEPASLRPLLIQLVNLKRGGKTVAMSTRSGTFTTLKEVVDEVGVDAARFFFLTRSHESHLDFDLDLAKKQSSENPVYYIQYAHARICNIFKKAAESGIGELPENIPWERLDVGEEISLMKKALSFPNIVEDCARSHSPHPITHYLTELAGAFHRYYNANRVVTDDKELTLARLAMSARIRTVIKNGLDLLGVSAPERM